MSRERTYHRQDAATRDIPADRDTRLAGLMPYSESARKRAVTRAEEWTRAQAIRLSVAPEEIIEAISRPKWGWFPDQVEAMSTADASLLAGPPHAAAVARIKAAPVLPIRLRLHEFERRNGRVNHAKAA
jgi:hypothetical protein